MSPTKALLSPILLALEGAVGRSSRRSRDKAAKSADTFCVEGRLPIDALTVSVKDHGLLSCPLPPAAAQALHTASAPARHGLRDKTMLDKRVRDTGELQAGTLDLRWAEGAREALQAEVASTLGLKQIQARLHNLLVYGEGQFFKPHQDTEKHPGMVATLVLVWPSPHIGGELVLRHGSEQARFVSQHLQADTIRWFAFYADCRHEVLPVAEGWRVVLRRPHPDRAWQLPARRVFGWRRPDLMAGLHRLRRPAGSPDSLMNDSDCLDHRDSDFMLRDPVSWGTGATPISSAHSCRVDGRSKRDARVAIFSSASGRRRIGCTWRRRARRYRSTLVGQQDQRLDEVQISRVSATAPCRPCPSAPAAGHPDRCLAAARPGRRPGAGKAEAGLLRHHRGEVLQPLEGDVELELLALHVVAQRQHVPSSDASSTASGSGIVARCSAPSCRCRQLWQACLASAAAFAGLLGLLALTGLVGTPRSTHWPVPATASRRRSAGSGSARCCG